MDEAKNKLITLESLKAAYDALLEAISLQHMGVEVTAEELNMLGGVTENVQDKINTLCDDVKTANDNATSALDEIRVMRSENLRMKTFSLMLPASAWENKRVSVVVDGMPADKADNIVLPCPTLEYEDAYGVACIRCVEQKENELVFSCKYVPAEDIELNVILFDSKGVEE